ncbi:MAG: choice-of-anchor D domain-containing protein, partial [bacterium]
EQVMGGSGSSSTVSTATPISGVAGHLYLAAITSKPNEGVLDVTGLGLTWQQVDFQCGGRKATSVSIWQAMGSPGAAGVVTATLAGAPENSAITVVRYSGADPINPTGSMVSGNTNGEDGTCGGGLDNSAYSFNLTTSGNGSLIFGAIAMRNRRHTPGPDYFERKEFAQGSGGGTAGLAIVEREVTTPATVSFDGTFSKNVDWAVVAVELKAAPVGDAPDITVLPPAHDFGDVVVSSPASKIFEVRNDGTENLSVSTTSLQGPNAADFSIVSGGGSFVLVPAASRNIEVSFTPAALGARSASLRLVSNDPDEGTFDVALSGTGVGPPAPDIAVTPASHDYGDVVVNTSAVKVFAVQNVGNADLSLTSTTLLGADAAQFSIDTGGGAGIIAPGATRNVQVSFNPTSLGLKNATLRIISDDPDEGQLDVQLSGTGVQAMPDISVTPASHNFGNVVEGASASKVFQVGNDGQLPLNVTLTTLQGPGAAHFNIVSGGGGFTLVPGSTRNIEVGFNPTSTGAKTAMLRITSDDPDENPLDVNLSGTGIPQQSEIIFVRTFATNNAPIRSFTNAGIAYHPSSGNLFFCDSEINQGEGGTWDCENVHEVPLLGNTQVASYDVYAQGGKPCPPLSNSTFREPTGMTFHNGFFYITDDDRGIIMRHDGNFGSPLLQGKTKFKDAEGITGDPNSGLLYVVIGNRAQLLVYDENLNFQSQLSFPVPTGISDPEGIAFSPRSNHLFFVSTIDKKVYELDLGGSLLESYDISSANGFSPQPVSPQGLTFAPSSDPNDDPNKMHLYIADGSGRIYETEITTESFPAPQALLAGQGGGALHGDELANQGADANPEDGFADDAQAVLPEAFSLQPNYPNPFNAGTTIEYALPQTAKVILTIFNVRGQEVRKLIDKEQQAGFKKITWNGRNNLGTDVGSGVYFLRLTVGHQTFVRKLSLQK